MWFFCIRLLSSQSVVCWRSSLAEVLCKYAHLSSVASSHLDWLRCVCPVLYFAHPNLLSANTALFLTMMFLVESGEVGLYSAHANAAPEIVIALQHFADSASPHRLVPSILCHQFMLYRYLLPGTLDLSFGLAAIKFMMLLFNVFISKVHHLSDR